MRTGVINSVLLQVAFSLIASTLSKDIIPHPNPCGQPKSPTTLFGPGILSPVDVPWNAHITTRSEITPDTTFAAILVAPSLVLASASYLLAKDTFRFRIFPISSYFASFRTRNFGDPISVDDDALQIPISHIRIHPEYQIGTWQHNLNNFALFHLKDPIPLDGNVAPVCLPSSNDTNLIQQLNTPTPSKEEEELVVTGWTRGVTENLFLRMKIQHPETCFKLWSENNETQPYPYQGKWCSVVGTQNNHTKCIHNDIGGVRWINGSYYFNGIVDNFYSTNASRTCHPGALYYFREFQQNTIKWIEDNLKCGPQNFTCSNGKCVNLSGVCNQFPDCSDASDEEPNFCRGQNFCTENEFACGVYGPCIPKGQVGDGVNHCEDGEDEEDFRKNAPIVAIVSALIMAFLGITLIIALLWRKHVKQLKKEIRNLTPAEVNEFMHGNSPTSGTLPHTYINHPVESLPWKKEYDIPASDILIGEEIDRGNSGIVFKGTLTKFILQDHKLEKQFCEVAVKTNLVTVGVHEFKALLTELKILAYVGEHANVLKFYGACTENIKHREVYLVLEYCPNDSLLRFLIKNAKYFVGRNCLTQDEIQINQSKLSSDYQLDQSQYGFLEICDLIRWATQIAAGMEYLASKNIVHGDLAARNVLLSPHLDAKISDFGLSRKLGYSGVYIKSTDEPIPWKWLSIETIASNTLSEKTDVWAYGVTLWEIFTLGTTPYCEINWNKNFLNDLEAGLRLAQPLHASDKVYDLMTKCWKKCPEDRPTFASLRDELVCLFHNGCSKRNSATSISKEAQLEYLQVLVA